MKHRKAAAFVIAVPALWIVLTHAPALAREPRFYNAIYTAGRMLGEAVPRGNAINGGMIRPVAITPFTIEKHALDICGSEAPRLRNQSAQWATLYLITTLPLFAWSSKRRHPDQTAHKNPLFFYTTLPIVLLGALTLTRIVWTGAYAALVDANAVLDPITGNRTINGHPLAMDRTTLLAMTLATAVPCAVLTWSLTRQSPSSRRTALMVACLTITATGLTTPWLFAQF
jgi:hypothetical protein